MRLREETERRMNDIAQAVDERVPEGFGFFVLIFPFGENAESRMNYASNGVREDILRLMKEFIIRNGGKEDWMKHI